MMIPESESLHRSLITPYRVAAARSLSGLILDCGGGLGAYLPYLQGEVVILDRSIEALQALSYPQSVAGDGALLPFRDGTFDNVWACAVAQYLDLKPFLAELMRVTKPGGRVLVLVPNGKSIWDRLKRLAGLPTWWDQEGIKRQYSLDDLRPYGAVTGEIRFLPGERWLRRFPQLGHTLMLDIQVA